jgi:hypothetical protein
MAPRSKWPGYSEDEGQQRHQQRQLRRQLRRQLQQGLRTAVSAAQQRLQCASWTSNPEIPNAHGLSLPVAKLSQKQERQGKRMLCCSAGKTPQHDQLRMQGACSPWRFAASLHH